MSEKIAIIDGGGRGSVLTEAYLQSSDTKTIYKFPGNDFDDVLARKFGKEIKTHPQLKTTDVSEIARISLEEGVTFMDVCQDNAVAAGMADEARRVGILTIGPSANAGMIESSKIYARTLGKKLHLPQPYFWACYDEYQGIDYLGGNFFEDGTWIKADGLAEGKGALFAHNIDEAFAHIEAMKNFGEAGENYLIEQHLKSAKGYPRAEEFSAFAYCSGSDFKIAGYAQDYKSAFDRDKGPNTGSMGCNSPITLLSPYLEEQIDDTYQAILHGLKEDGNPYNGILYLSGIRVNRQQGPISFIIEWNARWGDPEAQAIVPGIQNDFLKLNKQVALGTLPDIETDNISRVVVTLASKGYPENYKAATGKEIFGINDVMKQEGIRVYGGGMKLVDGRYYIGGGRIAYIVGEGKNVTEAKDRAYDAISRISSEGDSIHYRTDIGSKEVSRSYQNYKPNYGRNYY